MKQPVKQAAVDTKNAAADLIRQKLAALHAKEPNARKELLEVEQLPAKQRSKHQQYMHELSQSGKSLAEIQTEWHKYYESVTDQEKHEIWQEFYREHEARSHYWQQVNAQQPQVTQPQSVPHSEDARKSKARHSSHFDKRSVSDVRSELLKRVSANGRLSSKHHFQSIFFGMGISSVVTLLVLFSFFNERFVTPFINPSSTIASTPIITDPNNTAVDPAPKVVIPKINVDAPVVYGTPSVSESDIQASLENGVVHYPSSPQPGQQGNVVVLGHSASNIFNRGKFKFAFILLKSLDVGDTFYLHKDGKRFVYRVYEKKIVSPQEVSILGPKSKPSTATLITCDPPGLSTNRLVIVGEQITPDPATNSAAPVSPTQVVETIPSDAPTLWSRFTSWLSD